MPSCPEIGQLPPLGSLLPASVLRFPIATGGVRLEKSGQASPLSHELATPKHSGWIPPQTFKCPCWDVLVPGLRAGERLSPLETWPLAGHPPEVLWCCQAPPPDVACRVCAEPQSSLCLACGGGPLWLWGGGWGERNLQDPKNGLGEVTMSDLRL